MFSHVVAVGEAEWMERCQNGGGSVQGVNSGGECVRKDVIMVEEVYKG